MSSPCPKCGRSDFPTTAMSCAIGGSTLTAAIGRLCAGTIGWYIGAVVGVVLGVWLAWRQTHSAAHDDCEIDV